MESFKLKSYFLISFFLATYVVLAVGRVADLGAQRYWKTMLPNTPMPQALLDALPQSEGNNHNIVDGNKISRNMYLAYDDQNPRLSSQKLDDFGYEPHSPSQFLHQDFITSLFFLKKDLNPNSKISIHFSGKLKGTPFASPRQSHIMPALSYENLNKILDFFSLAPTSKAARIINQTISRCDKPNSINGKVQFCATSLDKMVSSVISNLKNPEKIKAMSMPSGVASETLVPYKVMGASELAKEDSLIACHKMSFPTGVFYCHQPKGATAYSVSLLRIKDGATFDTFAMCHEDTFGWSAEYVAFKTLGVKPGDSICHFLQLDNVIWYRV